MFGFSFWEVFILLVVALLVIGPERLPGVARKAGEWTYKVRKFVANAKAEMDSEFNMQDMKQLLNSQESEISKLRAMVEETRHEIDETGGKVKSALDEAEQTMRSSARSEKARAGGTPDADRNDDEAGSDVSAPDEKPARESSGRLESIDTEHEDELDRLAAETGEHFHRPFATPDEEQPDESEKPKATRRGGDDAPRERSDD
ncbi:Sec-independent protein translocase protein TatB [Guyparkeria sp.]|uniref:Sec-independent protein translocase protein TatB n=1 Tax=Guyparkeria sp. TaxID=2035736 RepID=UPI0039711503